MNVIEKFQGRVANWVRNTFGQAVLSDKEERALRVLEEAAEVSQAIGIDLATASRVLNVVYSRPVGELSQELAGTGVTLLALAESIGVSLHSVLKKEIVRIESKDPETFRERNREKAASGIGNYAEGFAAA